MESSTLTHTASATAFGQWRLEPQQGPIVMWAVTPSHLLLLQANAKKIRELMDAIEDQNANAALAVKGVKSFPRNEISTIRFLPESSKVQIISGTKKTEKMMWPGAFAGIASLQPEVVPESEDFSSAALKASRFGGLAAVVGFLVLHWVSHNLVQGGQRVNIFVHVFRDLPVNGAYILAAIGVALSVAFGVWRNSKPTQAWVMAFTS